MVDDPDKYEVVHSIRRPRCTLGNRTPNPL